MDYSAELKYHFTTKKGWINDPNGLVYFNGYYHIFYQHSPNFEKPWQENMHWGHARTKDFLNYEELPIALFLINRTIKTVAGQELPSSKTTHFLSFMPQFMTVFNPLVLLIPLTELTLKNMRTIP